jgi:hypothetical protein
VFGIGSGKDHQKSAVQTMPKPNALKQVLGSLFRRGTQVAPAQVKNGDLKPQEAQSKPLRTAFEAGNLNSEAKLRSLRSGNPTVREGQVLRMLRDSLLKIETEIAKERDRHTPDHDRLNGLKTLWAEDNDKMFSMMKGIRDRESNAAKAGSVVSPSPQVRSLAEFNESKGSGAIKSVDLDANENLKKMSELREKVEFSLASATDEAKKGELNKLLLDIDRQVLKLTQKALGG